MKSGGRSPIEFAQHKNLDTLIRFELKGCDIGAIALVKYIIKSHFDIREQQKNATSTSVVVGERDGECPRWDGAGRSCGREM